MSSISNGWGPANLHSLPCGTRHNLISSLAPGRGLNQIGRIVLAFPTQSLHGHEYINKLDLPARWYDIMIYDMIRVRGKGTKKNTSWILLTKTKKYFKISCVFLQRLLSKDFNPIHPALFLKVVSRHATKLAQNWFITLFPTMPQKWQLLLDVWGENIYFSILLVFSVPQKWHGG